QKRYHSGIEHQSYHNQQHFQVVPYTYWHRKPGTGWAYLLAWTIQLYHCATACGAPVHMICPCFLLQSSTKFLQSTTFDYSLNLLNHAQLP
ncbi:hypothetical protein ES319_A05G108300v1, partial [Gossypium barbadense]